MYNPISAMLDPLYKAEIAIHDLEIFEKEITKKGIRIRELKEYSAAWSEKLQKLLRIAKEKLRGIKAKELTPFQEGIYLKLVTIFGRVSAESGLKS